MGAASRMRTFIRAKILAGKAKDWQEAVPFKSHVDLKNEGHYKVRVT